MQLVIGIRFVIPLIALISCYACIFHTIASKRNSNYELLNQTINIYFLYNRFSVYTFLNFLRREREGMFNAPEASCSSYSAVDDTIG